MHLGKNETVPDREVVGIFDIENATLSKDSRAFLKAMQDGFKAVNLCTDLPASFVLTAGEYTDRIYISSISAKALMRRQKSGDGNRG